MSTTDTPKTMIKYVDELGRILDNVEVKNRMHHNAPGSNPPTAVAYQYYDVVITEIDSKPHEIEFNT
ncbi:MAG: hypothetical protein ACREGB_04760, partial [Candidatus Saccharimonadales bacterium]